MDGSIDYAMESPDNLLAYINRHHIIVWIKRGSRCIFA